MDHLYPLKNSALVNGYIQKNLLSISGSLKSAKHKVSRSITYMVRPRASIGYNSDIKSPSLNLWRVPRFFLLLSRKEFTACNFGLLLITSNRGTEMLGRSGWPYRT